MTVKKRPAPKEKNKKGSRERTSRLSEETAKSKRLSSKLGKRALVLRRSGDKEPPMILENIPSALDQIETIISLVLEPMVVLDFNLQVVTANLPFCQTYKITRDKIKGALFYQIGNGLWDIPELRARLEQILYDNTPFEDLELKLKLPRHQEINVRVNSRIINDQYKKPHFILLAITDSTGAVKPEESTEKIHSFPDVNPMPVVETDLARKVLYMNPAAEKLFPGLSATGIKHPFLAGLPSAITELKETKKEWVRQQVKAEGKWYGQTIYPVENGSRIRIYSADITDAIWVRQVLEASERRFKSIYAESPIGIEIYDPHGKLIEANRACLDIFGVSDVTEVKGFNLFEDPNLTAEQKKNLKEGKNVKYEGLFDFEKVKEHKLYPTTKSGKIYLDVVITPLAAVGEESQKGYLVQVQDITERKHRDEKLQQLNRVLKALSDSNQAMMRSAGESDYMDEVCRLIIEDCGYAMVWIGFAEDDENKTVRPVAQAGFEEGYLEKVDITWADSERGRGPTGTAIRMGKPAICRNMLTDPDFAPWRNEALKRGYASSIVLPLISGDKAFGAINIYSTEPDPFSKEEIDLLTELSNDLAYGIMTFRLRLAHQEAEAALAKSEEKYRFLYEEGQSFNLIIGPDQTVKDVNKAALDILGYRKNDVMGKLVLDFIPDEDRERVKGILAETFAGGTTQEYEIPVLAKDGSVHTILFAPGQATLMEGETIAGVVVTGIDITHRKQAEEAVLRAKEEWERTFESVPDLIAILDNRHKIVRINRAMAQKLGKEPNECIGVNCFKCVHGTSLPPKLCPHAQTLRDGQEHISELHEENLGGDFLVSTTPLFDEKGQMTGAVHVARDITERKQAEEKLRKQAVMLTNISEAIIGFDSDLKINFWSPSAERLYGYTTSEALRQSASDLLRAVYLDLPRDEAVSQLRKTGNLKTENIHYTKDGRALYVEYHATGIYNQQNKLTGIVTVMHDITERKKAEEALKKLTAALKEERDLLNVIKENTSTNLAYLNTDFNLIRVNSAFVRTFGHSEEELVGRNLLDLLRSKEYQSIFQKARDTGETVEFKTKPMKFKDQPERGITYWDLTLIPVKDTLNQVLGLEFSLVDVTEIKRAEEEIRALNESLKQQAADLAVSNKELEAFSYSVSHDLRAPLRNIDGFSQALLEDYSSKLDEKGKDFLKRVRAATQRMGGLIDDLLQLSLTMRKEMQRKEVDLSQLAHSIINELKEAEPERQVKVTIQEKTLVSGDARLLREMLVNLLGNAWKFTSQRSPAKIEFGHIEKDREKLFFVKDNGAGFDMKYADKLFIPFQRLHSLNEFSGNGIGLAIVRRIIERHGGSVWAEGEVEKGATFYFRL